MRVYDYCSDEQRSPLEFALNFLSCATGTVSFWKYTLLPPHPACLSPPFISDPVLHPIFKKVYLIRCTRASGAVKIDGLEIFYAPDH